MNVYKVLAEFIRDEVIPATKNPDTIAGLGMLAAGLIFKGKEDDNLDIGMIEAMVMGGFEFQPVITVKISDFLSENAKTKYPILNFGRVKAVVDTPFEIDKESAEKLIAKLKGK